MLSKQDLSDNKLSGSSCGVLIREFDGTNKQKRFTTTELIKNSFFGFSEV